MTIIIESSFQELETPSFLFRRLSEPVYDLRLGPTHNDIGRTITTMTAKRTYQGVKNIERL